MQELNRNKIIYSLNVEDIQSVSLEEIGRELSENEVEAIKEPLAENIGWYDAIANAIGRVVKAGTLS